MEAVKFKTTIVIETEMTEDEAELWYGTKDPAAVAESDRVAYVEDPSALTDLLADEKHVVTVEYVPEEK